MFDFAPTRALRQLSEYAIGLSTNEPNPGNAVRDLVSFLPVLAYDGANMTQIDAGGILDIAMAGTSATELNPGERSDVSWIGTVTPDRCDDIVIAKGMDDSQFSLNPASR